MGLFDSVYVACPHCGSDVDLQSKADDPYLRHFTLEDAPLPILLDIMNRPEHCMSCDGWLTVVDPRQPLIENQRPPTAVRKIRPPNAPECHPQGFKWWPDTQRFGPDDLIED